MTVEEWAAYAKRFGTDMVSRTAKEQGLGREDLDRLELELRKFDPEYKPPRRRGKPGRRARPKIPAEHQTGRVCEHCGRPLTGRTDRRTCTTACRVALHRAAAKTPALPSQQGIGLDISEW